MKREFKYSFMSFSTPDKTLRESLALAEKIGYSGFEPRVDAKHLHGIELNMSREAMAEAKAIAADSPVKLCCLGTSVRLASKERLSATMDEARRAIDVCAGIGIPAIRVFGGPIDEGCTRDEAIDQVAKALDKLSAEIGSEDITLCMETHDVWVEPMYVTAVMQRTRGKHIGVNWDVMHPLLSAYRGIDETFGILRPYIKHVHIHGGTRVGGLIFLPIGEGAIDHRKVLSCLSGMDYDGYLSGEWINWDRPGYLESEFQTLKALEGEL